MDRRRIAVSPTSHPEMFEVLMKAVIAGGGEPATVAEASGLIWADPAAAGEFPEVIASAPNLEWIQLPFAGIETFAANLDSERVWTCGKGVYADPVAELVVTLILAGFRHLHTSILANSWPAQLGRNLLGANITIIGAGGITESLLRLLEPWNTTTTVIRRSPGDVAGATRTLSMDQLDEGLGGADAVVLAAALTNETRGLVDAGFLAAMHDDAWLINVARGAMVNTDDLVSALGEGLIAGAALDVTDPEPLPDGHPLWDFDNCIITPHVGNTPEMGLPLLASRVKDNVERWIAGEELVGLVDVDAGY